MMRAVVPMGGQAFVAPRIRPWDTSDEVLGRASFAATRAKRVSLDQASTARKPTSHRSHQRSASMPHVEARSAPVDKAKPNSAARPTRRRMRDFHLYLPPEAQAQLDNWQASVHREDGQSPLSPPFPSASSSPKLDAPMAQDAPPHSSSLAYRRRAKHSSSQFVPAVDLTHLSLDEPAPRREERDESDTARTPLITPELDSTPSSPANMVPRTPSPFPARTRSMRLSSEWYIKQDAYAAQMHAHTKNMWNHERQQLEYSAAAGLVPAPPKRNGSSRPWPLTQAQLARQEVAQAKVQRALEPTKSKSPKSPKSLKFTLLSSPNKSSKAGRANSGDSVPTSNSSRTFASGTNSSKETSNVKPWTRLRRKIFI